MSVDTSGPPEHIKPIVIAVGPDGDNAVACTFSVVARQNGRQPIDINDFALSFCADSPLIRLTLTRLRMAPTSDEAGKSGARSFQQAVENGVGVTYQEHYLVRSLFIEAIPE